MPSVRKSITGFAPGRGGLTLPERPRELRASETDAGREVGGAVRPAREHATERRAHAGEVVRERRPGAWRPAGRGVPAGRFRGPTRPRRSRGRRARASHRGRRAGSRAAVTSAWRIVSSGSVRDDVVCVLARRVEAVVRVSRRACRPRRRRRRSRYSRGLRDVHHDHHVVALRVGAGGGGEARELGHEQLRLDRPARGRAVHAEVDRCGERAAREQGRAGEGEERRQGGRAHGG